MARQKKRRGEKRRKRRESTQNWQERKNRERRMQDFIENEDTSGDIYGWQDADGFGVESDGLYVDAETGVLINPSWSDEMIEVLRDMGFTFNTSSDEKRFRSLSEKYNDEDRGVIMSMNDYDVITSILGSDLYQMLKEAQYLDSAQIIDEILSFKMNITPEEVERALLSMVSDINNIETHNIKTVLDAMDLGFTLDEALELTDMDVIQNLLPDEGMSELRDRIMQEVEQTAIRRQLEQELREQGEQIRRRN